MMIDDNGYDDDDNDDGYLYDGDDRCIMMLHDSRGLIYDMPYTIYCIIYL
jgi:hypothetical protein